MNWIVALAWLLLAGGTVPLLLLWRSQLSRAARLLLCGMTVSYLWGLLGVVYPIAIGPHYSDLRMSIIQCNLWLGLAMAVIGLATFTSKGLALAVAIWLPSAWLYIRTVSFIA
jgi:hypothetical protein